MEHWAADSPPLAIHFIDNTDPDGIDHILNRLKDQLFAALWLIFTSQIRRHTRNGNGMLIF